MRNKPTLKTKLLALGAGFLLVAMASIGLTLWVTWNLEGGAAAVNEAGRMRMQAWRLSSAVQAELPPQEVQGLINTFDQSLVLLREGDAARPLFVPWDQEVSRRFQAVEAVWSSQRPVWSIGAMERGRASQVAAQDFVEAIDRFVLAIEMQLSSLTALLKLFQFSMMALAIIGTVVMVYTGYMYVIHPLDYPRQGLRKLESGDFSARVNVDTQDEFG